jgi:tetratricopeptide (TPR) repeat protein
MATPCARSSGAATMIRIRTLGGLGIDSEGRDFASLLSQRLRSALLVFLTVERDAARDEVRALFWPDQDPARGDRVLDRHLRELNRMLGPGWITESDGRLRTSGIVSTDVAEFEAAVARRDFERASTLYAGPFLDGFTVPARLPFQDWLATRRRQLDGLHAASRLPTPVNASAPIDSGETVASLPTPFVRMLTELKRRQVFRVAWGFCLVAWFVLQLSNMTLGVYFPEAYAVVLLVIILAFPIAILLAWVFELTPDGQLRWEVSGAAVTGRWSGSWHTRVAIALAGTAIIATTGYLTFTTWTPLFPRLFGATPNESTLVVFPFNTIDTADIAVDEQQLADALGRWSGITVINSLQVEDALKGRTERAPPLARSRAVAARLGAGRYVMGSVTRVADAYRVHARLYDAEGDRSPLSAAFIDLRNTTGVGIDSAFFDLGNRLLFGGGSSPEVHWPATLSVEARTLYEQARADMAEWNGPGAEALLSKALTYDPAYSRALLELAQIRMWSGQNQRSWSAEAERALAPQLSPREQRLAAAIAHVAHGEFPEACDIYEQLTIANQRDVAAWLGRAECARRDRLVIRDAASPTGWSFRSSYQQVLVAYRKAYLLDPGALRLLSGESYVRLQNNLFTKNERMRSGTASMRDGRSLIFDAVAELAADSIAFVPYPQTAAGASVTFTAAHGRAIQRQREYLRDIARSWARDKPSARSYEAFAIALDLLGNPAALDTLVRARSLADSAQLLGLQGSEVRMRLKLGTPSNLSELERARALADSILKAHPDGGSEREMVAALALLLGKPHHAARIMERVELLPQPERPILPPVAGTDYNRLLTYASVGAPADSLTTIANRLVQTIRSAVSVNEQAVVRNSLMTQSAVLAFSAVPAEALRWRQPDGDWVLEAQAAHLAGDNARVRRTIADVAPARQHLLPGDLRYDALLPETELLAGIGDLKTAAAWVDPTLEALRFSEAYAFTEVTSMGALLRTMALRAEIATALGDVETARKWARAVVTLWSQADPVLVSVVQRMRVIAGTIEPDERR